MRRWCSVVAACLIWAVVAPSGAWAAGAAPVEGRVVRGFDPPAQDWEPGHRGVDVSAPAGSPVVAPRAGVITFSGMVAGKPVVVIGHGATRTTLEPVVGTVPVGTRVAAGQPVGRLEGGHACPGGSCLHWGLKRGEEYLDPLTPAEPVEVRLLPADSVGTARARATARALLAAATAEDAAGVLSGLGRAAGHLLRPVAAAVTSPFGRRLHPIFHEWRLHAGVDLPSACGTPIRAAADGAVAHMGYDSSGGWRLVLAHGSLGGRSLTTSYLHGARAYRVRPGDRVTRGEVVGWVGSTGWSTGCHLHFGTKLDGRPVDPTRFW